MQDWTAPVLAPPFPFATATGEGLEIALRRALVAYTASRSALRDAVEECVRSLRAQHMSPEGTIITIKAFVRHTVLSDPARRSSDADHFLDHIVHWTVVAYFDQPPA